MDKKTPLSFHKNAIEIGENKKNQDDISPSKTIIPICKRKTNHLELPVQITTHPVQITTPLSFLYKIHQHKFMGRTVKKKISKISSSFCSGKFWIYVKPNYHESKCHPNRNHNPGICSTHTVTT